MTSEDFENVIYELRSLENLYYDTEFVEIDSVKVSQLCSLLRSGGGGGGGTEGGSEELKFEPHDFQEVWSINNQ